MNEREIAVGMRVRYPRTGTTGKVAKLAPDRGTLFVELESTGLLYRVDELVPATLAKAVATASITEDAKKVIERERDYTSGLKFQETIKDLDQSCEGGG